MNADGFAIRSIWRIPMCLRRASLRSALRHNRYPPTMPFLGNGRHTNRAIYKPIVAHGTWATKPERLANTRCGVAREAGVVDTRVFAQFAYAAGICVQSLSPAAATGRGPPRRSRGTRDPTELAVDSWWLLAAAISRQRKLRGFVFLNRLFAIADRDMI